METRKEKGDEMIIKGKERELGRECCRVQKILKIDADERLYLFKGMTYVRQQQAGRALID